MFHAFLSTKNEQISQNAVENIIAEQNGVCPIQINQRSVVSSTISMPICSHNNMYSGLFGRKLSIK